MAVTYQITYEHNSDGHTRSEKVLAKFEHEPTDEEAQEVVSKDTLRFHKQGAASFRILAIEPIP